MGEILLKTNDLTVDFKVKRNIFGKADRLSAVQKAVLKDEKDAKTAVRLSMIYRTLFMLAFMVVGAVVPVFNLWASLIPFLFPRLAIAIKPISDKNYKKHN